MHQLPTMKFFARIIFSVPLILCGCATSTQDSPPVASVAQVDLQRYSGTWYEIGSFPMFFQRHCIANTEARYSVEPEGKVGVHNRCQTDSGIDSADGIAEPVANSNNARLRVAFFRPFWADYWIIGLDPAYRWAVVGNPDRRYLWILSRSKTLPREQLDAALEAAKKQGYDLKSLRYTTQN